MLLAFSLLLLAASLAGLLVLTLQLVATRRHLRARPPAPAAYPGISILKPLCGVDDGLKENLACFAALDYPRYEVVLGVKDTTDPAYALARRACERWPERMRLVLQRGEPGFNPKVNQLVTLEAAARYGLLVVSDSNTRVSPDYLAEIAARFEDPEVACVTHPIAGIGERTLGSLFDNAHLCSSIGPGMIAAKRVAGKDVVVGKSMALRRSDLEALGGFSSMKDVLAEDYVLGRAISERLGKRVEVANGRVYNVSEEKTLGAFYRRYARWSVIHRSVLEPTTFLAQSLLNPIPLAALAAALHPSATLVALALSVLLAKLLLDALSLRAMRGEALPFAELACLPLKDAVLFIAYLNAFFQTTVDWRGNELRVCEGSRLVPVTGEADPRVISTLR